MRTARLRLGPLLVAPRTALGRPELVHLGHPLLELDILTFLIAVPLLLYCVSAYARQSMGAARGGGLVKPGLGAGHPVSRV